MGVVVGGDGVEDFDEVADYNTIQLLGCRSCQVGALYFIGCKGALNAFFWVVIWGYWLGILCVLVIMFISSMTLTMCILKWVCVSQCRGRRGKAWEKGCCWFEPDRMCHNDHHQGHGLKCRVK